MGGGPSGSATAIALARLGRTVILLERSRYDGVRIGETLPPIAQLPLSNLGVRDVLVDGTHAAVPGSVSAWGRPDLYEEDFIFNVYGHGWHLDRTRFDAALATAAEDAGARVCRGARVTSCAATTGGHWQIAFELEGARVLLHASFVVDATGRTSSFARRQGRKRINHDRLVGIVGFSSERPAESFDSRTLVEAGASGWWYSAELPSGQLILAYMSDADLLPRGVARVREHWHEQLAQAPHTRERASIADGVGTTLTTVSANSSILDRVSGERWLAVGDAAMTYDPLSSYGICKALNSGIEAANAIERWRARKADALATFAQSAQKDFQNYLATRAMYYAREQRWPASLFWQRRHTRSAAAG